METEVSGCYNHHHHHYLILAELERHEVDCSRTRSSLLSANEALMVFFDIYKSCKTNY